MDDEATNVHYPLDHRAYTLLDHIGSGVGTIVYKATCEMNSTDVAIKTINLDRFVPNLELETAFSHPNLLHIHCSFKADEHHIWIVMPLMDGGSLQSLPYNALTESCMAMVLKEILKAISYLHSQGLVHKNIKASNILLHTDGSVKLSDLGTNTSELASSSSMLSDVAYWTAPAVGHGHNRYILKGDIWTFGITALELAHRRPPISHLSSSRSLLKKRFWFSDYEKIMKYQVYNKFSKEFKEMVKLCLHQHPLNRPSADELLQHPYFSNCEGSVSSDLFVRLLLAGLPNLEKRVQDIKTKNLNTDMGERSSFRTRKVKPTRIVGWIFNEDRFRLDAIFFPPDSTVPKSIESEDARAIDLENVVGALRRSRRSLKGEEEQDVGNLIWVIEEKREEKLELRRELDEMKMDLEEKKMELKNEREKNLKLQVEEERLKLEISPSGW